MQNSVFRSDRVSVLCESRVKVESNSESNTGSWTMRKQDSVTSYRPISLTSPICKIMESIINDNIQEHLQNNNVIPLEQHGFTPGRSCSTQLLLAINEWNKALDDGYSVDVLYFDFQKAFDSVPHNCLISKLQSCGISGHVLEWIRNFLAGRSKKLFKWPSIRLV